MGGYDLVVEANKVLRYIQLKSSHRTAATAKCRQAPQKSAIRAAFYRPYSTRVETH
jgi:hypothetical protein